MSVEFNGKEYRIKKKGGLLTLNLSWKEIMDISEIKGLESLNELQVLNLSRNAIFEIEGLETLKNLVELHLDSNRIVKIKGLEALKNLKLLNLAANSISEIEGLDTLTNLEELHLESNEINFIKGLDSLINLHTLRLDRNRIVKVESFKNKEKLTHLFLDKNPLYDRITRVFSSTNPQNLKFFIQMSDKEIEKEKRIIEKARHKPLIRQVAPLEHKVPAKVPAKTSYTPRRTTYKKSTYEISFSSATVMTLKVFFGIIGAVLLISGFILTFGDVGQSGLVVTIFDYVLHLNALGITFLVIGVILLAVVTGGEFCVP